MHELSEHQILLLNKRLWEDSTFVTESTVMSKYADNFYVTTIESIHKTHQLSMFSVNDKKHWMNGFKIKQTCKTTFI